ncbi:sulfite exporter TauE/SafE family protein [Mesorhizobium sp. A623]
MFDGFLTGVSSAHLIFVLASALAAGLARGFSGFGAALVFVPLASAAIGPQVAVPLLVVVDGIMTLGLIPASFRLADRRNVVIMTLGAVIGVPVGIFLLTSLNPLTIRWAIVILVALLLALLVSGWRHHGRPKAPLTVLVGAVSGLFSGVAQVGGPPVVAYWLGGATPATVARANMILYFALSTVLTATGYFWSDLITAQVLSLAVVAAPLYGVGVWFGSKMFGIADEQVFRRICYLMIAFSAVFSMPILDGILH